MRLFLFLGLFCAQIAVANVLGSLESIVENSKQAESYQDFRVEFGAEAMAEKLEVLVDATSADEVCLALSELDYRDQSLFIGALEFLPALSAKICFQQLVQMHDFRIQQEQAYLDHKTQKEFQPFTSEEILGSRRTTLGPSESRYLSGPQGKSLPKDDRLGSGVFALTFDDGPHPSRTKKILDVLAAEGVNATFFVLGSAVRARPSVLRQITADNHSLGSHSYSHPDLSRRTYASALSQIQDGIDTIENVVGSFDSFFRFPYGARTKRLRKYLRDEGVHDFFWNVDTLDWKKRDPDTLLRYAFEQTKRTGRGIILFHDIHAQTVAIMPAFLRKLRQQNYKIVVYRTSH